MQTQVGSAASYVISSIPWVGRIIGGEEEATKVTTGEQRAPEHNIAPGPQRPLKDVFEEEKASRSPASAASQEKVGTPPLPKTLEGRKDQREKVFSDKGRRGYRRWREGVAGGRQVRKNTKEGLKIEGDKTEKTELPHHYPPPSSPLPF
jgi:hypothetical protein